MKKYTTVGPMGLHNTFNFYIPFTLGASFKCTRFRAASGGPLLEYPSYNASLKVTELHTNGQTIENHRVTHKWTDY